MPAPPPVRKLPPKETGKRATRRQRLGPGAKSIPWIGGGTKRVFHLGAVTFPASSRTFDHHSQQAAGKRRLILPRPGTPAFLRRGQGFTPPSSMLAGWDARTICVGSVFTAVPGCISKWINGIRRSSSVLREDAVQGKHANDFATKPAHILMDPKLCWTFQKFPEPSVKFSKYYNVV